MTGRETVCRVEPALVQHVQQLLADAGLTSIADTEEADGLMAIEIDVADLERAQSVIGLVLPQLLEPRQPNPVQLSDRLIRTEDPPTPPPPAGGFPGGLIDGRNIGGYADPLADGPAEDGYDTDSDRDFSPAPPPPIPRPRDRVAMAAWIAVIGGPIMLVVVHFLNLSAFWTAIGLAMFIGGFAALIARMDDSRKQEEGWDDGAVL